VRAISALSGYAVDARYGAKAPSRNRNTPTS